MVSPQCRFPGTTNKTSPTYPLGRDLTPRRPAGASRRDQNCCGSCCESNPPNSPPLAWSWQLCWHIRGKLKVQPHCLAWFGQGRIWRVAGWEEKYEGSDETRRRKRKRSKVEAKVEKQTSNQIKNSRLADICHSSNTKPVAWCKQNTN